MNSAVLTRDDPEPVVSTHLERAVDLHRVPVVVRDRRGRRGGGVQARVHPVDDSLCKVRDRAGDGARHPQNDLPDLIEHLSSLVSGLNAESR